MDLPGEGAGGINCPVIYANLYQEVPLLSTIEAKLAELGCTLPPPPPPAGNYLPATRSGNIMWLAGVGSRGPDGSPIVGKLGSDLTAEQGYEAARRCALNLLASAPR